MPLPWLDSPESSFPDIDLALADPNGLLAAGGDLSPQRLLEAYSSGIFPWFEEGQPVLWWSPDPRMVLFPEDLRVSKSLQKTLNKSHYTVTLDEAFAEVIACCAQPRGDSPGTWITVEMQTAYTHLFEAGHAHSVEVWRDGDLIGGLYGVALGQLFFGESMFSFESNASKIALVNLVKQLQRWNYKLIDCQVSSEHLESLGAIEISREQFRQQLHALLPCRGKAAPWNLDTT
ncbi:MAG: leucyl/phenylalanyl-tRNA--protein transferase [SAR86 cluster bacterium]|uniref:Leucyl/phenylalanyl-tRNA--protein transferase n=1 Tax=SAR86 cluster bacterium TaxID=2030880 RepID=A0A2A4X0V0_9GAMM|nr:MAG: leucyl/phenylalanyl-tRNA--protein transferase [SAR86 cluster bacterium]